MSAIGNESKALTEQGNIDRNGHEWIVTSDPMTPTCRRCSVRDGDPAADQACRSDAAEVTRLQAEVERLTARVAYLESEEAKVAEALRATGWRGMTCGPDEAIRSRLTRLAAAETKMARVEKVARDLEIEAERSRTTGADDFAAEVYAEVAGNLRDALRSEPESQP